jgi:hypothetical protein
VLDSKRGGAEGGGGDGGAQSLLKRGTAGKVGGRSDSIVPRGGAGREGPAASGGGQRQRDAVAQSGGRGGVGH